MEEAWKRLPLSKKFIKATYNRANFEEELDKYEASDYNKYQSYNEEILEYNPEEDLLKLKFNKNTKHR